MFSVIFFIPVEKNTFYEIVFRYFSLICKEFTHPSTMNFV
jgi:hypothetical protein